jgi:hypothetical protein
MSGTEEKERNVAQYKYETDNRHTKRVARGKGSKETELEEAACDNRNMKKQTIFIPINPYLANVENRLSS